MVYGSGSGGEWYTVIETSSIVMFIMRIFGAQH